MRTLSRATSLATAGTVVRVAPGTYTGGITTSTSGTATAPIVFVSDVKGAAKLVPASTTGNGNAWNVSGSYIIIDGFEMDGQSSGGWRRGVYVTGSRVAVKNNHIHHIARATTCDSNGGGGVIADGYYGGRYHDVVGNVVHHIGPGNPGSCGTFNGIYMASFDWTVKNNVSYQNTGDGITSYHDSGRGYVINNTVFRNWRGIIMSGGGFIKVTQGGPFVVQNNIVYDNNPNGTYAGNVGGIGVVGPLTGGSIVSNNYASNNRDLEIYVGSGLGTQSSNITSGVPGFVNYLNDGTGNYGLSATSQVIDKGASANAPATDIAGIARPQGVAVDFGAYEYKAR